MNSKSETDVVTEVDVVTLPSFVMTAFNIVDKPQSVLIVFLDLQFATLK